MVFAVRLQWIDIEKLVALQRDSRQSPVIERAFHYIGILGIARELVHALVPEHHAHRCARFTIRLFVGQVEVGCKALVLSGRTYSARYIHLGSHHIVPQAVQGAHIGGIMLEGSHIGHTCKQIHGTHGMTVDDGKVAHRHLILVIGGVPLSVHIGSASGSAHQRFSGGTVSVSALFQKMVGKVEKTLLSGGKGKFHQSQFNFLVSGNPMSLAHIKERHAMFGHPYAHIHKLAFASGLVIGHTRLYHVSGTVHLVLVHVGPAVLQPGKGIKGIDISVGLLAGCYLVNPLVQFGFQFCIACIGQRIGHAFHCLVDIRIVKENAAVLASSLGGPLKVLYAARLVFYLVYAHRQRCRKMFLQPRRPKIVLYGNMREIHLIDFLQGK